MPIKHPSSIQLFLVKVLEELNFLTIDDAIRNIIPPIRAIPGSQTQMKGLVLE